MTRKFSQRSIDSLRGVHPDLVRVIAHALHSSPLDFTVIEGRRTRERQASLVAQGLSRTKNSRHLYGLAVDLVPVVPKGADPWDWKFFDQLGPAVKAAAARLAIPVTWGGDWKWRDGPHFELPHALYPDGMIIGAADPVKLAAEAWRALAEPVTTESRLADLERRIAMLESKS